MTRKAPAADIAIEKPAKKFLEKSFLPPEDLPPNVHVWRGEWDKEGVYVYQAYSDEIADYALEHQTFGGPAWKAARMTWIKPSFAWMVYRAGYGNKPGQERILKIKVSHEDIAYMLSQCTLVPNNSNDNDKKTKTATEGSNGPGRIQWDPERDLFQAEDNAPRRRTSDIRAIQIGLPGPLSEYYIKHILSIQEVTALSHKVAAAHRLEGEAATKEAMDTLIPELPNEKPYLPQLPDETLRDLGMLPTEDAVPKRRNNKKNVRK